MRFALPFLLFVLPVSAATWYASTSGSVTNGTYSLPWSIEYAVSQTTNTLLSAGDTVVLKNGTFICTQTNSTGPWAPILEFYKSGTTASKITYKSETPWQFTFDGGVVFGLNVSNIVFRELRVTYSGSDNRQMTNVHTHPGGVNDYGKGNELLHNLIENTGHPGIGSWSQTEGKLIAGNIVRFAGANDFVLSPPNAVTRGSGYYLQNTANPAVIQGNISYYNYTTGMKAYGEAALATDFRFVNNISTLNSEAGLFYHQQDNPSSGVLISSNYVWNTSNEQHAGIRLGFVAGGQVHSNAVVTGNYSVSTWGPFYVEGDWRYCTITNNFSINQELKRVIALDSPGGGLTTHTIDFNTYRSFLGSDCFVITNTQRTFAVWQTDTTEDASSTWSTTLPTSTVVNVCRPSADPAYAHVAVFNWPTNTTTTVDLSSYFTTGDRLYTYDAQAFPTAYTNFVYTGGTVSLELTRTNIAPMLGTFTNLTATWSGFDPRFRAFVIHSAGPDRVINATAANVGTIVAP